MQAKDFNDTVLQALGNLSHLKAHKPVAHKAVIAETLRLLKMDPDALGERNGKLQTHTLIGQAFRNMRVLAEPLTESKKRGEWALTKLGVEQLAGEPEQSPSVEAPAAYSAYDPYDDPYLRSLAAQTTACFGMLYAHQDPVCSTCPLKVECGPATWETHRKESGSIKAPDDEIRPEEVKMREAQERAQLAALQLPRSVFLNASKITAEVEQPCGICGDDVAVGETVQHSPNRGVFHLDCFDEVSQNLEDQAG